MSRDYLEFLTADPDMEHVPVVMEHYDKWLQVFGADAFTLFLVHMLGDGHPCLKHMVLLYVPRETLPDPSAASSNRVGLCSHVILQ
jgi:hypothetical protein